LETGEGRVIVERSAIAKYLIEKYDTAGKFKGNDSIRDEELTSFAGASIGPVMMLEMIFDLVVDQSPFFVRWLFAGAQSGIRKVYTGPELDSMFKYLDSQLGEQDYFMGESPGRADFMVSWPVDFCVQKKYVDLSKYTTLSTWYERCHARAAWKESLNRGNGYKLGGF